MIKVYTWFLRIGVIFCTTRASSFILFHLKHMEHISSFIDLAADHSCLAHDGVFLDGSSLPA